MHRRPGDIAQVGWLLDVEARQPRERHPVVAAVDDGLAHRAETRVRVRDPLEALAVDGAAARRGELERTSPQRIRLAAALAALHQQGLDQQCQPLLGLAEDERRLAPGEHIHTQRLALERLAVHLRHRQGFGVQLGGNLELGCGPLPLSEHRQQLKQEHALFGIRRIAPHLVLQHGERRRQLTSAQQFSSPVVSHGTTPRRRALTGRWPDGWQ